jgi:hypothetical protein
MRPSLAVCLVGLTTYVASSYWWDDLGLWALVPIAAACALVYAGNRLHWAGH